MEYVITRDYSSDELMHYGVVGMKWGVRKTQAKSYQKQLNSLDKESTHQIAKYMKADVKAKRYGEKGARYISKHDTNTTAQNTAKLVKITRKMNKAVEKRDAADKAFKSADSKSWKIIAEAAQNGYKITTKQIIRDGEIGRTWATAALAGPIGLTSINLARYRTYAGNYQTTDKRSGAVIDQAPWAIVGNKYKVRDSK